MLDSKKISKSRNWYISLREFIERFNPDYLRFYLASITPYSQSDINFDWKAFSEKINNELIANIGNFINRALSFTQTTFHCMVPKPLQYDEDDNQSIMEIKKISSEVGNLLMQNEIDKALKRVLKFSTHFNQYFQKKEPWSNKSSSASTTIFIVINAVRSLAIVLEPFLPFSSEKIWSQLGCSDSIEQQSWDSASELKVPSGHTIGQIKPLFIKVQPEDIEQHIDEL